MQVRRACEQRTRARAPRWWLASFRRVGGIQFGLMVAVLLCWCGLIDGVVGNVQ